MRAALLWLAPQHAMLWDHVDFMAWSDWACEHGPIGLYDLPLHRLVNVNLPREAGVQSTIEPRPALNVFNYPPGSAYVMWLQGLLWRAIDPDLVTSAVPRPIADFASFQGREITSRVANTVTARSVNAAVPILADFLMAWGIMRLVRWSRAARGSGWTEVIAFALTVFAPPIFLNSAFWTQMDSCLMALLVWCMYLLATGRFFWAGVLYGAALMTKAQAILLLPVLAFVCLAMMFMRGGSLRHALQMWKSAAGALTAIAVVVTPFATADRGQPEGGWLRWYYRGYATPIREQYPQTTLKAFNLWWLDFLAHGQRADSLSTSAIVWPGLTKERIGQVLLTAAILAGAALCAWRWRWELPAWVALAFLVLFAAFVWPTRAHERYVSYCLPFLIAAALVFRPWVPLLATLFLVGGFEITWYLWLAPVEAGLDAPARSRGAAAWSLVLAVLTLASFLYAHLALLPWWRRTATQPARRADVGTSASLFGEPTD